MPVRALGAVQLLVFVLLSLSGNAAASGARPSVTPMSSTADQAASPLTASFVKSSIEDIAVAESLRAKRDKVQALNQWVVRHPNDVSTDDIDALAGLLSDPDDGVRGWIAGALGILGDKALRAAPALQRALQERPCIHQPLASADAIRLALSRMGVQPVHAPCTDPFGT